MLIPTAAVGEYSGLFNFATFNVMQSTAFADLYQSNVNFVLSAPTGSGKHQKPLCMYLGPTKALCSEKHTDWASRFSPYAINCVLLTDDRGESNQDALYNLENSIVLMTPEKLDALTRQRKVFEHLCGKLKLLCVDEIHTVGESRGAILEAIIGRMKNAVESVRIVGALTTIGNIGDFEAWLAAKTLDYGHQSRPVAIQRHILPFASNGMNHFQFENKLTRKLGQLIEKYSAGLPTLVFCSTRKSAEMTAAVLARDPKIHKRFATKAAFSDSRLDALVSSGVAFHNGGLPFEDRRAIECLFTNGKLRVLCTTSALAMGVNLPAYLVILKGTKKYTEKGYEEYNPIEIQRMIGRVGVPQFDKLGVAIIMTSQETKNVYSADPEMPIIGSRLQSILSECLLTEIVLGNVTDKKSALKWVASTFLSVGHLQRSDAIDAILRRLAQLELVTLDKIIEPSEVASTMIRNCLSIRSMQVILETSNEATHEALLQQVCKAIDREDCKLYQGDKGLLSRLAKSKSIKFPLDVSTRMINEAWQKAFVTIQVVLAKDDALKTNYLFAKSSKVIMLRVSQIIKCMVKVLALRGASTSLKNAIELEGAINGESWHEGVGVLRQIDGIGPGYAAALTKAGMGAFDLLRMAEPSAIEFALKRNPPFGLQVLEKIRRMPMMSLDLEKKNVTDDNLYITVKSQSICNGPSVIHLLVTQRSTSDSRFLCYKKLRGSFELIDEIQSENWSRQRDITVSLMCSSFGMLLLSRTVRPNSG